MPDQPPHPITVEAARAWQQIQNAVTCDRVGKISREEALRVVVDAVSHLHPEAPQPASGLPDEPEHYATISRMNLHGQEIRAVCECGWKGPAVTRAVDAEAHARKHEAVQPASPASGLSGLSDEESDELFDAIKHAYVGTEPWFVGPAHLGHEAAPEAVALQPEHFRRISRIHAAVAELAHPNPSCRTGESA